MGHSFQKPTSDLVDLTGRSYGQAAASRSSRSGARLTPDNRVKRSHQRCANASARYGSSSLSARPNAPSAPILQFTAVDLQRHQTSRCRYAFQGRSISSMADCIFSSQRDGSRLICGPTRGVATQLYHLVDQATSFMMPKEPRKESIQEAEGYFIERISNADA
jgi:hypothetical protein